MGAAVAIAINDLKLLVRDKAAAFFVFVFPMLIAVFFGAIFGGGGGEKAKMKLAVADLDKGKASAAFVQALRDDGSFEVVEVESSEAASEMVRKSNAAAGVTLPKGFQDASDNMFSGKSIPVEAVVDPGRKAESGLITGKLTELSFKQMQGLFGGGDWRGMVDNARKSLGTNAEGIPEDRRKLLEGFVGNLDTFFAGLEKTEVKDEKPEDGKDGGGKGFQWNPVNVTVKELPPVNSDKRSSYEISFPQGMLWGLMGCVTGFGISLAQEKQRGTLVRLTTAPISRGAILFGKALACFAACLMVQSLMLAVAIAVFKVHVSSWPMMGLAFFSSSMGFAGMMMIVAGLTQSGGGAEGAGRAMILVLTMIGGGSVPLAFLPDWAQTASSISPFKWALLSIEGALWRGFSIGEMALPCGILIACGIVGWVVGTRAFKWAT